MGAGSNAQDDRDLFDDGSVKRSTLRRRIAGNERLRITDEALKGV